MLFNSYGFIFLYLPITLVLYFWLNSRRLTLASKSWLVAMSLVFYSWWDVKYLPLILGSMIFNYALGTGIARIDPARASSRKALLVAGIAANVVLLGYFKYTDFFIENMNAAFSLSVPLQQIVLPLGISFFTFTQIAYLVDAYKSVAHEYDLLNYSLFVTFFPHLLAGPIIHHKEMMPQFDSLRNKVFNYRFFAHGLFLFALGLFKKVVIADQFALWANAGFDVARTLTLVEAWVVSLSYTFQLYFDFSGYTDMALGSSLMFGIRLPDNFHSPYKACDIQDFWRRWHMTLSRFLQEYIYIPLGGNRRGHLMTYTNLMATFLIGGLWHGAAWTFVFWGFLHGAGIVLHRIWKQAGMRLPSWLGWLITFNFVNAAWVFFRAKSWDDAVKVLAGMAGMNGVNMARMQSWIAKALPEGFVRAGKTLENLKAAGGTKDPTFYMLLGFVIILCLMNSNEWNARFRPTRAYLVATVGLLVFAMLSMTRVSEFLYFNF